jgi:hypothetical protein
MPRRKKQKFIEGAILRISYGDGRSAFAQLHLDDWLRVLEGNAEADPADLDAVAARPERFRVLIASEMALGGQWPLVGTAAVRPEDRWIPDLFVQLGEGRNRSGARGD